MKIKVQTKINFDLEKLNKETQNKIIMNNFIRPIGNAAAQKVRNAFTKSEDILGQKYKGLSKGYHVEKIEKHGNMPIMVAGGTLAKSIEIRTNEKDVRISILSTSNNQEYLDHLTGNTSRHLPQRKWFFTKEEEPLMLESEQLMKKQFDTAINEFTEKFVSEIIGNFRNLGKGTII